MPGQRLAAPHNEHAIRQIKHVLDHDFSHLVDMSDYEKKQPEERQKALHSRSLAALAVRGLTGLDNKEATECLIDGRDDHGIDAIAVSETASKIWLVQSKWDKQGRAGLKQGEALKFLRGWRLLENREFDRFNKRIQGMADKINTVLLDPHTRVHFVVAMTGDSELHPDVSGVFDEVFNETNGFGLTLDLQVMGTHILWEQIRAEQAPEDVPITATMRQWIYVKTPVEMYQGIVSAEQVAKWVGEAGNDLFHRNIRASLGTTDVNAGILASLASDPEHFLFFHNGITVICRSLQTAFPGPRRPSEPVILTMNGASVVNGAQSVSTLHRALQDHPDALSEADISMHVICVDDPSSDLPSQITDTRNRQNRVEERDFVALDETQALIREDFGTIDKFYSYKRGEPDPVPEQGCSVVEASLALACAHPNVKLAVRAKQNVDTLWERGTEGAYPMLFSGQPSASQIWGSVRLRRAVGDWLHQIGKDLKGRGSDVADRGDLLVTHLVFQSIGRKDMGAEEYDWEGTLARAENIVDSVFPRLLHHIDTEYGPDSKASLTRTLSDPARCRKLTDLVLRDVRSDAPVPAIDDDYRLKKGQRKRKQRRPNSAAILLNAGVLHSGTRLEFRPTTSTEEEAMKDWLAQDPRRAQATWTTDRKQTLLWEADGRHYSPTGLVMRMYELAGWENSPVAVQGPAKWHIAGKSMAAHAEWIFAEIGDAE
ncbi:AIPR family protein [Nocardiopsis ganjiahuensis]|uniref:AIPR family protein n=1 Tax=Nocardiopsis ganjiahuensis TaxID=239984 RepID=UPI000476E9CE|nr:AIPR family protein [Nocardiopsis ganjiahuensis]